jgi:hypothetical protein
LLSSSMPILQVSISAGLSHSGKAETRRDDYPRDGH